MFEVETIKNRLRPVFSNYNINSAILFGSYAKGMATEKSDIDFFCSHTFGVGAEGMATEKSDIDLMVDSNLRGLRFFALIEDIREALDEKEVDVFDVTHIDNGSKVQKDIYSTGVKIYG